MQLLASISIKNIPELHILLHEKEDMDQFLLHAPEIILLRWMKYHFEKDGETFPCANFGPSMKVLSLVQLS